MPWIDGCEMALAGGIVLVFGAMIGSFLNVVAYRMPRGRSVVAGRSHCPACGGRIPARDNIPVLGWFLLGGRCRQCREPIAPRYPAVEAVCGGVFLLLYAAEVASGGASLPFRPPDHLLGHLFGSWFPAAGRLDLVAVFLYHAAAFCLVMTWGLVSCDGWELPPRHVAACLAVAALVPAALPWLHPVGVAWPLISGTAVSAAASMESWWDRGLAVSLAGAASGWLAGAAVRTIRPGSGPLASGLVLLGIVFGWQGLVAVLVIASAILALAGMAAAFGWVRQVPWEAAVTAAMVMHAVAWRPSVHVLEFLTKPMLDMTGGGP